MVYKSPYKNRNAKVILVNLNTFLKHIEIKNHLHFVDDFLGKSFDNFLLAIILYLRQV